MKDRVPAPGREGRVKLTLDNSEVLAGVLEMDDNPTVPGTPYNKLAVLRDLTAALYGLDDTAVPDDIFAILGAAALYDGNGGLTDTQGRTIKAGPWIASGSYVGTGTYGANNPTTITFPFAPAFVMLGNDTRNLDFAFFRPGSNTFYRINGNQNIGRTLSCTMENGTLTMTATESDYGQANHNGDTYRWFAIG